MDFLLKEGERLDDLQISGLKIIQSPSGFCFGMDAVLLSGFVRAKKNENILDLGTGSGILPLLLYAKTEALQIEGLEIDEESVLMARRSVAGNGISMEEGEERFIRLHKGDIKEASSIFGKGSFDIVTSNPPYMIAEHGITNPDYRKQVARHEVLCTFKDLARETALVLRPGGRFFLVHRPFRLAELLSQLVEERLEPKRLRFVHPHLDKEPNMVLVEAVKYGKSRMKIEPPLIVFNEDGSYTEELVRDYSF